jgi:hypothetical protein
MTAGREVRRFWLYREGSLAMVVEDRPGTLHSRAAPGPSGPPRHPFVHATAYDALREDELGRLLRQATDFDDYLTRLIAAGYDVMSADDGWEMTIGPGFRLVDDRGLVGVVWPSRGQAACLWWQPPPGQFVYDHATLTPYRRDGADAVLAHLAATADFPTLRAALEGLGLRLVPLPAGA